METAALSDFLPNVDSRKPDVITNSTTYISM